VTLFLDPRDYARWSACPGSAALCEADPEPKRRAQPQPQVDDVVAQYRAQGATVELTVWDRLDLGPITGERGAQPVAQAILIVTQGETARLEIWHTDVVLKGVPIYFDSGHPTDDARILCLAALAKYSLLHEFTTTNCGTLVELAEFGDAVRRAGALALELRQNVAALESLVVGPQCKGCPAAYRCPQLIKETHESVFGEVQALDEPVLTPIPVTAGLSEAEAVTVALRDAIERRIPLIEAWISSVRTEAGRRGLWGTAPSSGKARKKAKRHRRGKRRAVRATPPESAD
jgi:hypothetical protein